MNAGGSKRNEPVMQVRCIYCLREQYAPDVWDVSHGEAGCAWCSRVPPVFHDQEEYRRALAEGRRRLDTSSIPTSFDPNWEYEREAREPGTGLAESTSEER